MQINVSKHDSNFFSFFLFENVMTGFVQAETVLKVLQHKRLNNEIICLSGILLKVY